MLIPRHTREPIPSAEPARAEALRLGSVGNPSGATIRAGGRQFVGTGAFRINRDEPVGENKARCQNHQEKYRPWLAPHHPGSQNKQPEQSGHG
jgi:hypothetical protein